MICQNCGQPVEPHDVFCGRCGYLLSTANIGHPANTAGQRSLYVASQTVVVEVPECRVVPGETARFPFSVHGGERSYSIHEFSVSSDNPNFNPRWAHIVKATDGMRSSRYILEIRPANIGRRQYGSYPISIRCAAPDAFQHAIGQCTLIIKPCVRLTGKPTFRTWPGGVLSMSLENCGGVPIDVSVSISHHGSSWSKGWEFELDTEDGPFEFKETFEPPADGRGAEFDLDVSAEGISLIHIPLRPKNLFVARKHVIAAAVVLIAAALGITLAKILPGPALTSQSISFTSEPSRPTVGATYVVAATGGGSGNPVTLHHRCPERLHLLGCQYHRHLQPAGQLCHRRQPGRQRSVFARAPSAAEDHRDRQRHEDDSVDRVHVQAVQPGRGRHLCRDREGWRVG